MPHTDSLTQVLHWHTSCQILATQVWHILKQEINSTFRPARFFVGGVFVCGVLVCGVFVGGVFVGGVFVGGVFVGGVFVGVKTI